MTSKDNIIVVVALFISVVVHTAFALRLSHTTSLSSPKATKLSKETFISFNLAPPAPTPVVPPKDNNPTVEKPKPTPKIVKKRKKPKRKFKPRKKRKIVPLRPPPKAHLSKSAAQLRVIKKRYFATLLNHIERNKYYPEVAMQEGIKGAIRVSFRLLCNGQISRLVTDNTRHTLSFAARQTMKNSLPLPQPPVEVSCPLPVTFTIRFRLR